MTLLDAFYCAIGGALGAGLRYIISFANLKKFPLGTFLANIAATILLCLSLKFSNATLGLFLTAGLAASLSTFSTFAAEIDEMLKLKKHLRALIYAASSVICAVLIALFLTQ